MPKKSSGRQKRSRVKIFGRQKTAHAKKATVSKFLPIQRKILDTASPVQYHPGMLIYKMTKVVDNVATGAQFRNMRKARKMPLHEVKERTGLSISYLSELERGRKAWTKQLTQLVYEALR